MIAVHHEILRVQGVHHFNQRTELFGNLRIQDGNSASTACRFGSGNVKACFPINDPINQVVIHGDSVVLQIHIVFGYATLIEPQVTSAMAQNENVRRALSFETEWQRSTGTDTMIPNAGFGTTQTFLDENPELAAQFQAAYEESVQWVLDHPAEAAALAEEYLGMKAAIVEAAIPNMGLTFKSAQDAKEELDTFYNLLYNFEPSMIGGKLPDEGLFYAG